MPVIEGWRERHGSCRFATFRADEAEGFVVAACQNPHVGDRYCERFCAQECERYEARPGRMPQGRIPVVLVKK